METVNEVPSRNKQLNVMETEYLQKFLTEEGTPVGLVWVKSDRLGMGILERISLG
jgi:hypothetical protein